MLAMRMAQFERNDRPAWLDSETAYSDASHQIAVQQAHGAETLAAREALVRQLAQARAGYAHDVLKDLAEAEQKTGELRMRGP